MTDMLETARLRLIPLDHSQLLLMKNDPLALSSVLGVRHLDRQNDPATLGDLEDALEFWLAGTQAHPADFRWYTNWEIVLKQDNVAIGGIGFAGLPGKDGRTMVGYGLDLRYHGAGYATEALGALLAWGWTEPRLSAVIADTPVGHLASHRVLEKNGFARTGEDGQVTHWLLARPAP